jgi:hypothetical protein
MKNIARHFELPNAAREREAGDHAPRDRLARRRFSGGIHTHWKTNGPNPQKPEPKGGA